jgi:HEAT repeat protein
VGGSWSPLLFTAGALVAALVCLAGARKALAHRASRRKALLEADLRPRLARVVIDGDIDPNLIVARRARGRALDRLAAEQLPKLKGEGKQNLASLLERRNVLVRANRSTRRRGTVARAAGASLLGNLGSTESVPVLRGLLLEDTDPEVRTVAARALGHLGDARAVVPLVLALEQQLVPPGVATAALLAVGERAVEGLRAALQRPSAATRSLAAELLGVLETISATPDLLDALSESETEVRIAAARALGQIAAPDAEPALVDCLGAHEPAALRAVAAEALGRLGASTAVDDLVDLLADTDYWTAHNAAQALAMISADGRGLLEELIARNRPGEEHAREAIAAAHVRGRDDSTYVRWIPQGIYWRAPLLNDPAVAGQRR